MPKKFKLFRLGDHKVRGFLDDDGNPWVIAADLAAPLELSAITIRRAIAKLPDKDRATLTGEDFSSADALLRRRKRPLESSSNELSRSDDWGGARRLISISEGATHSIILRSDAALKEGTFAFRFREWLASEVLPSLRKDGAYVVTRRARTIVQALPGWAEARQSGKTMRRSLTDAVADFVAYAKAQGSNHAPHYYKAFTALAYRLALGLDTPPAGGRDGLSVRELLRVEAVEDFLQQFIDEEREAGTPYKAAFAAVKARAEAIFLRRAAA